MQIASCRQVLAGGTGRLRQALMAASMLALLCTPPVTTAQEPERVPGRSPEQGSIRLSGSSWIVDAPTKVADALDFFNTDSAGRALAPAIEVIYQGSGKESLHHLRAGEVDFALSATTPAALALMEQSLRGGHSDKDIVILATVGLSNRSHYLVAHKGRDIRIAGDFRGKRVAVTLDSSGHFGWSQFCRVHSIDCDRVTLVDSPASNHESMLVAGDVDAAVTWEPWGERIRRTLGSDALVFTTRQLYTVNWLLVSRRQVVNSQPELVQRVVSAYGRAIDLIGRDPSRARELHARVEGIPASDLEPLEEGVFWRLGLGWSVLANMEAQMAWLKERPRFQGVQSPLPSAYLYGGALAGQASDALLLPPYLQMVVEGESP